MRVLPFPLGLPASGTKDTSQALPADIPVATDARLPAGRSAAGSAAPRQQLAANRDASMVVLQQVRSGELSLQGSYDAPHLQQALGLAATGLAKLLRSSS